MIKRTILMRSIIIFMTLLIFALGFVAFYCLLNIQNNNIEILLNSEVIYLFI